MLYNTWVQWINFHVSLQLIRATNDIFLRPDVSANIDVVDLINNVQIESVISETINLLKRKLQSSNSEVVSLTLSLCETIVKNCKESFYLAINDYNFMKELSNVCRKYCKLTGPKNREVSIIILNRNLIAFTIFYKQTK